MKNKIYAGLLATHQPTEALVSSSTSVLHEGAGGSLRVTCRRKE